MPITVNTNMSSIIAQNSLYKSTNKMNTALQRLSTGLRINSAKDDAAGSAISTKLEYKVSSYDVAKDNAQMGQSMLDTANGTLSSINSMLQRMRDLSEQAANGTYGKEEREAMQAEIDGLTAEIKRIKETTEFNGKKLFELPKIEASEIGNTAKDDFAGLTVEQIIADWDTKYKGTTISIGSAESLQKLAELVNSSSNNITETTTFEQTADIDLSGINWTPIGKNTSSSFSGTFDGKDFEIKNLIVNNAKYGGLFGCVGNSAEFYNINLVDVDITANADCLWTGALVGFMMRGNVNNCTSSGKISSKSTSYDVGGLIGYTNYATIKNSSSSCNVEGLKGVGGLIGGVYNNTVDNCFSEGNVTGTECVGGLIGQVGNALTINNSSTISKVTVSDPKNKNGAFIGSVQWVKTITMCKYNKNINPTLSSIGTNYANEQKGLDNDPNLKPQSDSEDDDHTFDSVSVKTNLQVGIGSDENSVIQIDTGLSITDLSISVLDSAEGKNDGDEVARKSLAKIDKAMAIVTEKMTEIGSAQNRLESIMEFQEVQRNALTSANSLIKDADIAEESSIYIKNQILQNVTSSLLATANQSPQIALQLI